MLALGDTRSGETGYALRVDCADLDATRFEDLVAQDREALRDKRFDVATERLTRASGLWRGPALDGLPVPELVRPPRRAGGAGPAVRARDDRAGATVVISAVAGTAGVGKTALAVHRADRSRELFPDGRLYADLRGYDALPLRRPFEVLSRFLHALGVAPERVPPDLDEAAAP